MQYNYPQSNIASQPLTIESYSGEQVRRYAEWLDSEARRSAILDAEEGNGKYNDDSLRTIVVGGQDVRPFAPFRDELSARKTLTAGQALILGMVVLAWLLWLILFGMNVLAVTFAVITVLYIGSLIVNFLLTVRTLDHSPEEQIDDAIVHALANADWPRYTILCPLYHEAEVVPQFTRAMQMLDYPTDKLEILLLTEQDDAETRDAIQAMRLPQHFKIVTVPPGKPRTKPRACNFGLLQATGDYVVIYDIEDIPDSLQLKKAVLTFANHGPELGCVQAKLNYYNTKQNLLTRWFTVEYSLWFDLILPGMQQVRWPLPLGGTSNHFRMETLHLLGAWDPFNVTEDCDLGLRLARFRLKTAILDSTTYEEANSQVKNWLRQRSRWVKGYMQTYLVHMRLPWHYLRRGRLREFLSLQLVIGGKTVVLFVNPLMWLMLLIYILFRPLVVDVYHAFFPTPILYMGVLCLIFGNFFYAYSHLVGCLKRGQYGLIKWALFIPIYWLMISIAAFIAFLQLIVKPHYWEKTQHGFHLQTSPSSPDIATMAEEEKFEAAATTLAPAFISTKGVPPPLPASGSFSLHQIRPRVIRLDSVHPPLPASNSVSDSTVETEELESTVAVQLPAFMSTNGVPLLLPASSSLSLYQIRPRVLRLDGASPSLPASNSFSDSTVETEELESTVAVQLPAFMSAGLLSVRRPKRPIWQYWPKDPWLVATFVIACIASIASCWYFFQHHQILLYNDAYAHLRIARRVIDSVTPGVAQLGGVWLPLPHLLMLPFIWNDYLWRTGLAGSFPSMLCYVVAVVYLFLSARRLTRDSRASFMGTLLFIVNPNILYLQATPLTEIVCMATFVMACYYFLAWTQDNHPKHLIWMAASIFLATLVRFDGWGLLLALLVLIVVIGWIKLQHWAQIEGTLLVFGTLAGLGIGLWFLWCKVIFGDPFYFHHYLILTDPILYYTYHDLLQSILAYMLTSIETVGPILFVLALIAVAVFLIQHRLTPDMFGALAFLTPFVFYVLMFYTGQATVFLPGVGPANRPDYLWNVRFGVYAVAPAALFLATLARRLSLTTRARLWPVIGQVALVVAIVVQTFLTANGGIISLQDGLYGFSCSPEQPITVYLAQHYAGGRILEDVNARLINESEAGIDLKNTIYEGSGELWKKALNDPASTVEWIVVPPTLKGDPIASHIDLESSAFLSQFTLVVQQLDGVRLYHRNGHSPLPTRPIPSSPLTYHRLCHSRGI